MPGDGSRKYGRAVGEKRPKAAMESFKVSIYSVQAQCSFTLNLVVLTITPTFQMKAPANGGPTLHSTLRKVDRFKAQLGSRIFFKINFCRHVSKEIPCMPSNEWSWQTDRFHLEQSRASKRRSKRMCGIESDYNGGGEKGVGRVTLERTA